MAFLENGTRVFSRRGVGRAFGSRQTGINDGALEIPPFLGSKALFPFISEYLMVRLKSPIEYLPKHGGRSAIGYEASILPAICEAILDAKKRQPTLGGANRAALNQGVDDGDLLGAGKRPSQEALSCVHVYG